MRNGYTLKSPRLLATASRVALFGAVAMIGVVGGTMPRVSGAQDISQDIEVFFTNAVESSAKPNVLFILDTSQSMYSIESSLPPGAFDPNDPQWDSGPCDAAGYYWAKQGDATPSCAASVAISAANFQCTAWKAAVDLAGFQTQPPKKVAQNTTGTKWATLAQANLLTYCQGDGDSPTPVGLDWAAKGKNAIAANSYTFYRGDYLNYLAGSGGGDKYRIDVIREVVGEVVANTVGVKVGLMRYGYDGARDYAQNTATACEVLPDSDEANRSSNGAPVVFPVTDLDAASALAGFPLASDTRAGGESDVRRQLRYQLGLNANNENLGWVVDPSVPAASQPYQVAYGGGSTCPIPLFTPGGRSPIGGAMLEAYLYYAGKEWSQKYGKQADLGSTFDYPSVPQSRIDGFSGGEIYKSPIEDECAKNFIILLSDGTTEQDNDVDGTIRGLPGFKTAIGANDCDNDPYLDVNGNPPPSQCVDDAAEYMFETDLSAQDGLNNVITYTVGFKLGQDAAANSARQLLSETAQRGGGDFVEAGDAITLKNELTSILRQILTENTSFSAPAVTVNAFNRTQNLNDLYISLFRPSFNYRWLGNLKKYRIDPIDGDIVDQDGDAAIDPSTGFFLATAQSFWSNVVDGNNIALGGAAGEFDYSDRDIYSNLSDNDDVALTGFPISGITDPATLGIQTGDTISATNASALTAAELVNWMYGQDVADADGDTTTTETRLEMGDPLHGRPTTVIYGGTAASPDVDDALVFAITNDGYLHAFDPSDGSETWAFIPGDQLSRMRDLYYNEDVGNPADRGYGLDGNIRVLRIDENRNGIIETTGGNDDKVYLFFGQRRGGSRYYALDVTSKTSPKLVWSRDYAFEGYGTGQSWSSPQPMRIRLEGDSQPTLALAVGGGYDPQEDQVDYVSADTAGDRVLILDALDGDVIWWAGSGTSAAGTPDLVLSGMDRSIPGDIRVIDLTGDGLADRMYASDLGGRVWRFDIINGAEVDDLVQGGVFASLGLGDAATKPAGSTENRRFFYAPDVSLITNLGTPFLNVAIGSGHRELPATDTTTNNWFYSMRDYNVFSLIPNANYRFPSNRCTTTETAPCHDVYVHADGTAAYALTDVTSTLATVGTRGWKLALASSGADDGEKALAESRTFQNQTFFTTYAPRLETDEDLVCAPRFGVNKLYIVNTVTGGPVQDLDTSTEGATSLSDRSRELEQGSIAPEVVFVFPTPDGEDDPAVPPICLVGLESCGAGVLNPPVRTYWRQRGAD
jgi:type IV pilus assembly protein PilY1